MRPTSTPSRSLPLFCFFSFIFLLSISTATAQDKNWRPIVDAELKSAAIVEADADAEVIFWEVRVDDSNPESMVMKHYIRVKIFTDRGREKYSKIDIPFTKGIKIKDIMARVIKPDGSISELTKAEVFDREIAKTDKIKVKAKSFAVPNIAPGVVVEYKYQEVYDSGSAEDMRMTFQHDVPIRNISYYFKPYNAARYLTFNMDENKFVKDKGGFFRATLENVPAIHEESYMPPEDEVKAWLLLYYSSDAKATASDFWSRAGGYIVRTWDIKDTLKPSKELKTAATSIASGATAPDDQMAKIFEFCKTKVKNISFDTALTDEQKELIKPNKSTGDTYKKLQGTRTDINELFASLATALGYEARLAFGGDRSERFFNVKQAHESFISFSSVAVKINGRWKYYTPGDKFVPYGLLTWKAEDTAVLLLAYKDYITTETPASAPEASLAKRTGKFKLSEDGTLEGTVRIEYTGHLSNEYKLNNYEASANKSEEMLKDAIKEKMSTAEVSSISISNISDPEKPFTYEYKIKVPNYAQKTGKRLFLQPGFFEYGSTPAFSAATRKYSIFFHYPWSENDDVEIEVPKGFELDSPDVPAPIADPNGIGSLKINVSFAKDTGLMKYQRKFYFGGGGNVLFQAALYQPVKTLFDTFNKADTHTITLKQK